MPDFSELYVNVFNDTGDSHEVSVSGQLFGEVPDEGDPIIPIPADVFGGKGPPVGLSVQQGYLFASGFALGPGPSPQTPLSLLYESGLAFANPQNVIQAGFSLDFTVAAALFLVPTEDIAFVSLGGIPDSFSLTLVPVPAALPLMSAALLCMSAATRARWRRRRG